MTDDFICVNCIEALEVLMTVNKQRKY